MAVVENQLIGVLGQAGGLLLGRAVETFFLELDAQGIGQQNGAIVQRLGIQIRVFQHLAQILSGAGAVQAGLIQILRGAHENSGLAANCGAQRAEVAAGYRGQKKQRLLRVLGHVHQDSFGAHIAIPGFHAGEPFVGGRVGGAAEECDHEQVVNRLIVGQDGMNPQAVSGVQVGHFRDRQGFSGAVHGHFDLGPGQVEGSVVRPRAARRSEECEAQE